MYLPMIKKSFETEASVIFRCLSLIYLFYGISTPICRNFIYLQIIQITNKDVQTVVKTSQWQFSMIVSMHIDHLFLKIHGIVQVQSPLVSSDFASYNFFIFLIMKILNKYKIWRYGRHLQT